MLIPPRHALLSPLPPLPLPLSPFSSLTDSAIEVVAEECQKLQRLDLYWDVVLTDISITALSTAAFPPLLTHLNLSGLKHITDAALVPLLRRCTNLTHLDLTRCEGIRDEALRTVGQSCPRLRTLLLYATPAPTDAAFEAMAPGVPHLTHVDLTGMKFVTDKAIAALATHCKQIETLGLQWVTPLTDQSLVAMGEAPLACLRNLSVHGNIHITQQGIEALAKGCPELRQLDINGAKNLGKYRNNFASLKQIFSKLEELVKM